MAAETSLSGDERGETSAVRRLETKAKEAKWRPRRDQDGRARVWASCAHASLCKFTSGSRRSLSRPRIS